MGEVTESFLKYLEKLEQENVKRDVLADFLSVASKLLLIKSKILLPSLTLSEEEESEIKDLEKRVRIYQEFKQAKNHIKSLWHDSPLMFSREFLKGLSVIFYPPAGLTTNHLLENVKKITLELEKILKPFVRVKGEIINLKKKIEEVFQRLTHTPQSFKTLHKGEKKEIIVLFLAVLHLIKQELVEVEQHGSFGDILISRKSEV